MIVLGIDQGIAHFGYAILDVEPKTIKLIDYGCFVTPAKGNQQERIYNLVTLFENLVTTYQPSYIVHERLFFSPPGKKSRKKSASILNTNMITGTIWYIAGKHKVKIAEYSPQTVKKTLCGNGRAEKDVMINYVESKFSIECAKTKKEHICDAVSIGMTHIVKENIQQILDSQEKEVQDVHNAGKT